MADKKTQKQMGRNVSIDKKKDGSAPIIMRRKFLTEVLFPQFFKLARILKMGVAIDPTCNKYRET